MSFEDEMLELNSVYQNTKAENEELKARVAALEQLAKEAERLLEAAAEYEMYGQDASSRLSLYFYEAWQKRADELLREEQTPC